MKKQLTFGVCIIILLLIIIVIVFKNYKLGSKEIKIDSDTYLWNIYDENIKNIKRNMNDITIDNDNFIWWKLKTDIEDKTYNEVLNMLVADIRMCYLDFVNDSTSSSQDSKLLLEHRNKDVITKDNLQKLIEITKNDYCHNKLKISNNMFNNLLISNDKDKEINFLTFINEIHINEINNNSDYEDILSYKVLETTIVSNLSSWLASEYYKYE